MSRLDTMPLPVEETALALPSRHVEEKRGVEPLRVFVEQRVPWGKTKPMPWRVLQAHAGDGPPVLYEGRDEQDALRWAFDGGYTVTHVQTINENWLQVIDARRER